MFQLVFFFVRNDFDYVYFFFVDVDDFVVVVFQVVFDFYLVYVICVFYQGEGVLGVGQGVDYFEGFDVEVFQELFDLCFVGFDYFVVFLLYGQVDFYWWLEWVVQ